MIILSLQGTVYNQSVLLGVEAALLDINVLQKIIILGNSMQSLGAGLQAYQGVSNVLKDERK